MTAPEGGITMTLPRREHTRTEADTLSGIRAWFTRHDRLRAQEIADEVVQRVAELPDRTSPDDWPDAGMLVTADELRAIVIAAVTGAADDRP